MSTIESHIVQMIHPDYPTPSRALNEAYENHASYVQAALSHFVQLTLPQPLSESLAAALAFHQQHALNEIEKLHQPFASARVLQDRQRCGECKRPWPCSTAQALELQYQLNRANSASVIDKDDEKP